MAEPLHPLLQGMVAMASGVAALFFLRFWRRTRDGFFLLFSCAFGIDAITRFSLAWANVSDEAYYYLPRLLMFILIIIAVVQKNRT